MSLILRRLRTLTNLIKDIARFTIKRLNNETPYFRPHHYLSFEITPGLFNPRGPISHNALGFRGPEIEEKTDDTLRIVCMGESVTYCPGLSHEESYPFRVELYLKEHLENKNKNIEVINAAVPGYNTAENLINFIFKIEPLKPDLVVFFETINDLPSRQYPEVQRDNSGYCLFPGAKKNIRSLRDIVKYFKMQDSVQYQFRNMFDPERSKDYLFSHNAEHYEANLRDLIAVCRANKCEILLIKPRYRDLNGTAEDAKTQDPLSYGVYLNRVAIDNLQKTENVAVLDMMEHMPPPPFSRAQANEYYADSVHLSAVGANRFGTVIAKHILDNDLLGLKEQT